MPGRADSLILNAYRGDSWRNLRASLRLHFAVDQGDQFLYIEGLEDHILESIHFGADEYVVGS